MNHLVNIGQLHNQYFAMRHGKSEPNELGIILSHPDAGTTGYGLVEEGRQQAKKSGIAAKKKGYS
jgi:broad specificity phosphatase PhoE